MHMKKDLKYILLILIIVAGCIFGGYTIGKKEKNRTIDSITVENAINEISELATVEYVYTNMAKYESTKEFYGWKVPLTTSKFIISYDGVIKMGIDTSKVAIEVNGNTVTVTMPQPEILSHEIDMNSLQVMDEKYSILNKVDITDFNKFYADQSNVMEQKAFERGLKQQAQTQSEKAITSLIQSLSSEEVQVTFKY